MTARDLSTLVWPTEKLSDALDALASATGLGASLGESHKTAAREFHDSVLWHADRRGFEAERVVTSMALLQSQLEPNCPALLRLSTGTFLALASVKRGWIEVLTPSYARVRLRPSQIAAFVTEPVLAPQKKELEMLFGADSSCSEEALNLFALDLLENRRFDQLWRLKLPPGAGFQKWVAHTGVARNALTLVGAHIAHYLLWILSWLLIGQLTFSGQFDRGWTLGWTLLTFTLVPLRLLTTWKQGTLAIGFGGVLKARLFQGAIRIAPDEIRSQGIGHFLAQVFEAETVENLALSGALDGLLALVEIVFATTLLGWAGAALIACVAAAIVLALRFERSYAKWTELRYGITHELIEAMAGHRTRLVQQPAELWHESEDASMAAYSEVSRKLDRAGTLLTAVVSRTWLLSGLACMVPALTGRANSIATVGAELGGVLLGYSALKRITASASEMPALWNAWKTILPLFRAASRKIQTGTIAGAPQTPTAALVEAEGLTYRYRTDGPQVLRACTFSIERGDRILLEGVSGGGKSTLASLITGARDANSGLLLLRGLDKATIGDEQWRRRLAAAPQFHENHILTETLAFNLLMGSTWPASAQDLQEAEAVCRELGLGTLLDAMPAGLMQMVGEGGWQLSHGERSRIFLARALLQRADLMVLDESFAALDPENLETAMECTLRRAETVVVIAHP